jgi:AraC family transcriptional activator of pobA
VKSARALKTHRFKSGFAEELEVASLKDSLIQARDLITTPHRTDFHQVVWMRKGKATHLVDFRAIPMQAHSLLFIRKDRVLRYDQSSAYDGTVIRFTDAFFIRSPEDARFLQEGRLFGLSNPHPMAVLDREDPTLPSLIALLEAELARKPDHHRPAALQNLLHTLLIAADRKAPSAPDRKGSVSPATSTPDFVPAFVNAVETGFRTGKKVFTYAERLGVTEKRLQEATWKALGKKPKALIDERVALEAKRMLLFGGESVKEIAFDLGFEEVTNFIKWFRKQAGTTPADFRARYRP